MGNITANLYYNFIINDKIKLEEKDELYRYARYFDAPDSMLYKTGYDSSIENNLNYKTETMKKAVSRAILDRNMNADKKERFLYLSKIPKKLLKNCAFQNDVKSFWRNEIYDEENNLIVYQYDEETLRWVLKYKNIEECL